VSVYVRLGMHKNSPFWNKKWKNFLRRGTPLPRPHPPTAPRSSRLQRSSSTWHPPNKILVTALTVTIKGELETVRRHFQWPWTTPNLVFKLTPFFDTGYLTNGYRYRHSYYGRRIGNRTQAFKCYHFQWPSVTSNPHFKVTIVFNVNDSTTTKSCMIYLMVPFPVTLGDT